VGDGQLRQPIARENAEGQELGEQHDRDAEGQPPSVDEPHRSAQRRERDDDRDRRREAQQDRRRLDGIGDAKRESRGDKQARGSPTRLVGMLRPADRADEQQQ
jgi:hypothetical protein